MVIDSLDNIKENIQNANQYALGYPVNREHAFKIDYNKLGVVEHSFSATYLNNIASPYYHGAYTIDNIKQIEVKLIEKLAVHFNLINPFGYVTYGGTEANFVALWWHRQYLFKKFNAKPILVCSSNSHYSLKKIANQLDIETISIDADYKDINYNKLEEFLINNTSPIIYCVNFGTTVSGSIEDVNIIKNLLDKYLNDKYKIHGDGAIYGIMMPYIKKDFISIFDYVDTLSFSTHKFLGSFSIAGVVLCKSKYLELVFDIENTRIDYIQNAIDVTSSGSRQGLFSLEIYLLIEEALKTNNNNITNLEALWCECVNRAKNFVVDISQITDDIFYNTGQLSVIIPAPCDELLKLQIGKKYGLMPVGNDKFGIYVLPRSSEDRLKMFIDEYKVILKQDNEYKKR